MLSFLGCLLAGLVGCAVDVPKPWLIRSVYVEETVGAPSPDLARYADIIHDTSVRTLRQVGFTAATEPAEADAFLRSAWFVRPADAGKPEGRVTLRISLVARDGTLVRADDVVTDTPAVFLTNERIADLVRVKLAALTR